MSRPPLLGAAGLIAVSTAFIVPSGTTAQEPTPVIGAIAQGSVSTQANPNGDRRTFFPIRLRCQEKGSALSSFSSCSSDRIHPEATVTYSVSAATRAKYKLPSATLAKQQFTGESTTNNKIKASRAMSKALARIKNGQRITIKEKVAFTFPVVETRTDSTTFTNTRGGGWSLRTSNIDDGTTSGGGKGK